MVLTFFELDVVLKAVCLPYPYLCLRHACGVWMCLRYDGGELLVKVPGPERQVSDVTVG